MWKNLNWQNRTYFTEMITLHDLRRECLSDRFCSSLVSSAVMPFCEDVISFCWAPSRLRTSATSPSLSSTWDLTVILEFFNFSWFCIWSSITWGKFNAWNWLAFDLTEVLYSSKYFGLLNTNNSKYHSIPSSVCFLPFSVFQVPSHHRRQFFPTSVR